MASKNVRGGRKAGVEQVETPERILAAALRLMADGGYAAVSLREITAAAGANIAAVNYHFGSKERLLEALLERHVRPVNRERLERLAALERERGRGGVDPAQVVEAYLAPLAVPAADGGLEVVRFRGRMLTERGYDLPEVLLAEQREVSERCVALLARLLPGVGKAELFWRLHFACGVIAHTLLHGGSLRPFAGGLADEPGPGEKLRRMVGFCAAGFQHGVAGTAPGALAPEPPVRPQLELF